MATYDSRDALFTFDCEGMATHSLWVASWQGSEAVSRPYRFDITLATADANLNLHSLAGRRATFAVRHGSTMLPWHGVITEAAQAGMLGEFAAYRVVLEPRLALLRTFRRSDVFLDQDISGILRTVLADCGLAREGQPGDADCDFIIRAQASAPLPFVCQFEETSLDFLSRRLEREGIYYWFEQQADAECVVFGSRIDHQPSAGVPLQWRPPAALRPEDDDTAVTAFAARVRTTPASIVLRDFSGSRADLDLTVGAPLSAPADSDSMFETMGEMAVYGEHYDSQAEGHRLATIRAEEAACRVEQYEGECVGTHSATALRAGGFIDLSDHFRNDCNARFYVTEAEHHGSQPLPGNAPASEVQQQYDNRFTALPAAVQFRPARLTRQPRVIGMTTALIDGEGSGKYAEINENGCYKVRFLFASRRSAPAHNSAWIRKATPYAGSDHGMHLPLLKGAEVLITFLGGNPDRPVIAAALTNSENPNRLSAERASQPGLRTAGGNALAFEDREGEQSVVLGSPVQQSHIALGAVDPDSGLHGVRVLSQNHMQLTSGSFEQNVPGIYRQRVIAGASLPAADTVSPDAMSALAATPPPAAAPTPAPPTGNYNGAWWDGYGTVATKQGITITEFGGESVTVYGGNWNVLAMGLRTDTVVGAMVTTRIGQTTSLTLSNRLDYQAVGWKKASVSEDHTAATYTGRHLTKTVTIGTKTEYIGSYALNVTNTLAMTATNRILATAPRIRLTAATILDLQGTTAATLNAPVLTVGSATTTDLDILAENIQLGTFATDTVAIGGATIAVGTVGIAQTVTVQGAMVSVTPEGLLRLG